MSSFGEILKRERELREITLREVSEATKVNLRYLDALEHNDFRHLPGGVFNKGFVRAYSQFIGVDEDTMVTAYLQEVRSQEARDAKKRDDALQRAGSAAVPRWKANASRDEDAPVAGNRWRTWKTTSLAALLVVAVVLAGYTAIRLWGSRTEAEPGASSATTTPERVSPPLRPLVPPPAAEEPTSEGGTNKDDPPAPKTSEAAAEPTDADPAPIVEERAAPRRDPPDETAGSPTGPGIEARLILARRTSGSIDCDGRDVRSLDSLPSGAELEFRCARFLVLHADDGGAVRLGLDGSAPTPLAPNGVPVRGHRVIPSSPRPVRAEVGSRS